MSAQVSAPTTSATAEAACSSLTFSQLADKLNSLTHPPTLAEVREWVTAAHIAPEDFACYRRFRDGTYARNRILKTDVIEMLVLCWQPGQCTVIHDHNGSFGIVRVLEGHLLETIYELDETKFLRYVQEGVASPGAVTGVDLPDIHRLSNPKGRVDNLVTLHIYCPPLYKLNTYKENSPEVGEMISGETPQSCEDA